MNTTTLWRIEYVGNDYGIWESKWFLTYEEARVEYGNMIQKGCKPTNEPCGEYGEILIPEEVEIEMTPEGVLAFANECAVAVGYIE